jgi:UDP-glucuronate decarboxylase
LKALITGGSGFIGYHLAQRLATDGHQVSLCDNLSRGRIDANLEQLLALPNVTFHKLDLTDQTQFDQLPTDQDVVFHLAAINGTRFFYEIPYQVMRANLLSLVNVLDWLGGSHDTRLVWTSSSEVYADSVSANLAPVPTPEEVPFTIQNPPNPRMSYAVSKMAGELLVRHYAEAQGLHATVIRPHNIYGPRMGYEHVIPQFIMRILDGDDPFKIYGGDQSRAFCYVSDFVTGLVLAAQHTDNTQVQTINLGNDQEVVIQALAEQLFEIAEYHPGLEMLPSPEGSVDRRCPDLALAKQLLGYQPQVQLQEGLRETYQWYLAHHAPLPLDNGYIE